MFILHTSNKAENLLEHLNQVLNTPLSSPFLKEQFMIQSQGMQRWLSQQLAEKKGVWANFEFYFPSKFFGAIVDQIITDLDSHQSTEIFSQDHLVWHFDRLFRDLSDQEFSVLQNYMKGESVDLKRYQLAEKLAYLFDQYQFMRPDWLRAWMQGEYCLSTTEEKWQAKLWRQLQADYNTSSKGELWISVINKLAMMGEDKARELLPERLSVFGINAMSPIYLKFLETIGKFTDVHVFLLNPVESYWADITTKKQLAKRMLTHQDQHKGVNPDAHSDSFFDIDNPLLTALGQQGRDFQQLLMEQTEFELNFVSFEAYGEGVGSILSQLQNDILQNTVNHQSPLTPDNSLSVHACHSRMRETEVLKNLLLKALEENADLSLRDIVIMAPDISKYAPYVSSVFADIPHAIADKSTLESNDPLNLLLRFLSLSQNRWELESVFEVLEQAVVYEKFGLIEADLENIRSWIDNTQIRWGESAAHRRQLGFPEFTENSWQAGLQRMLMGYVNANEGEFCDGILPFAELEGSQAQALGGLVEFIQVLGKAKSTFESSHTLKYWVTHLTAYSRQLFSSSDEFQPACSQLISLIHQLTTYQPVHQEKVSLDVILAWLTNEATNQQSGAGFLRGQLTFCSMLPMRAIPFKVIALMGMNEGEYPRIENRPVFDLMANDFRKGDRSPRIDERYQFLELLLSARQQLIMTYIGQSQCTNAPIPASVVISELLEVLDEHYQLKEDEILTLHPLQPHSRQYFSTDNTLFSYSDHHYKIANSLNTHSDKQPVSWWEGEINHNDTHGEADTMMGGIIHLADFLQFYREPQRHFLNNQLQIIIPSLAIRADETEHFILEGLIKYQIENEWVTHKINGGMDSDSFYQRLMAQGRWLSGNMGIIEFEEQRFDIEAFAESVRNKDVGNTAPPLSIDQKIGDYRIVGSITNQYETGSLFYRYAKLKGKDLLPVWISHLLALQQTDKHETWLISKDAEWHFQHVNDSQQHLATLVAHYIQGNKAPSPLIIDPAIAWQEQQHNSRSRMTPLQKALSVYEESIDYHPYLQLLYQGLTPNRIINECFEVACEQLITPIWLSKLQ